MISQKEAYQIALDYIGSSKRVTAHLTDYGEVCVVEFGYKPKSRKQPLPEPTNAPDDEDEDMIELDPAIFDIPIGSYSPILIDKRTSKIYETGSDVLYPADCYADCYLSSGYTRGKPTSTIVIAGVNQDFKIDEWIALLINNTLLSNAAAKRKLKLLQQGDEIEIEAPNAHAAIDLAKLLRKLGAKAMQRWIGDGIPQYAEDTLFEIEDTTIGIDLENQDGKK